MSEKPELEERTIGSYEQISQLLGELGAWRYSGALKLLRGSFDVGTSMIDVEFEIRATGERWHLHCLNEAPSGGGFLRRLSSKRE